MRLDPVYDQLVDKDPQPFVEDNAYGIRIGYTYGGDFRQLPTEEIEERIRDIFKLETNVDYEPCQDYRAPYAKIKSEHTKWPSITMRFRLGHTLNCCFLHYTLTLHHLEYSKHAQRCVNNLHALLSNTAPLSLHDLFALVPDNHKPKQVSLEQHDWQDGELPF